MKRFIDLPAIIRRATVILPAYYILNVSLGIDVWRPRRVAQNNS